MDPQMDENNSNGIDCQNNYHSNDVHRFDINVSLISGDKRRISRISEDNKSMSSSKSSTKSNGSESRNSIKSQRSDRKTNESQNRSFLPIKDRFCWDCHKEGVDYSCKTCLRSFHKKCSSLKSLSIECQLCPECIGIMKAEEGTNPSGCMQWLKGNVDRMTELLEFTIITVKHADKYKSFEESVPIDKYPTYLQYIVNPMDLSLVEQNVKNKTYASTNSFLADIKWIYHNCVVFNSVGNKELISEAKNIIRVAKQECEEIEICPDCYLNYYKLDEDKYFAEVCERPHAIVWAKLKGHPFWPAKVVRYNPTKNEVDVRFFGTHDKCWLKPEKCFFMSQSYPYKQKPPKFDQNKFDAAIGDMNLHLDLMEKRFKNLFKFYPKHMAFSVDKLYITRESNPVSNHSNSKQNSPNIKYLETIVKQKETPKMVLNSYNGIEFKTLKVNASKFDLTSHLVKQNDLPEEDKSPPLKRFKKNSLKSSPKQKCFSKDISIREEMSSSIESDHSFNEFKERSKMEVSFNSSISSDRKSSTKNPFNENKSISNETNESNSSFKKTPILSQSQTVTVSGKSSKILNLNNLNKTFIHEMSDNSNNLINESNDSQIISNPKKSSHNLKTNSSEDLLKKKNKTLSLENRNLRDQLTEANNKITAFEEEVDELKKSNEELQISIVDIKKKQWCTNCSKEAILPCCWNTSYCTVECQHQHWPTHSKTCRRRQQIIKT